MVKYYVDLNTGQSGLLSDLVVVEPSDDWDDLNSLERLDLGYDEGEDIITWAESL